MFYIHGLLLYYALFLSLLTIDYMFATELQSILNRKYKLIKKFKPAGMAPQQFQTDRGSNIVSLFELSKVYGPTWTGLLNNESTDFQAILTAFTSCKAVSMLPPIDSHIVEYSILQDIVV